MLGLRIGYKYYRSQQKPQSQIMMENANTRQQALIESIKANQDAQRANGARVVVADSSGLAVAAADTLVQAK
jgi:hypothetical protein